MIGVLNGEWSYDGGTVAILGLEDGRQIASEPRMADDLLTAHFDGEEVTVEFEAWQVIGRNEGMRK